MCVSKSGCLFWWGGGLLDDASFSFMIANNLATSPTGIRTAFQFLTPESLFITAIRTSKITSPGFPERSPIYVLSRIYIDLTYLIKCGCS